MFVLRVRNVEEAYREGRALFMREGVPSESRAGPVLTLEQPLAVVYSRPMERVLLDEKRDANPFFHLMEALWLLAGRNDARWLDQFVRDFSSRFAEEDGHLHGSYGFRWRNHFDVEGGGRTDLPDQIETVIHLLKKNPADRRVVLQMWDPAADLAADKKDLPCNLTVVPRIVKGVLDITVLNRSNDFVWGLTGANAVQFSFLQEYLAGRIGVEVGAYWQISTNAHCYFKYFPESVTTTPAEYPETMPIGVDWDNWDADLRAFTHRTNVEELLTEEVPHLLFHNSWFARVAVPVFRANVYRRKGDYNAALKEARSVAADDWRIAAVSWLQRRMKARSAKA